MKKRILSLLLVFALVLTLPAMAASNSTGNFVRTKSYAGQFSDLTTASTFYDNVSALYEYGLSVGKVNGTFGLTDSVTVSQIIIFAARIRSLYALGDPESGAGRYQVSGEAVYIPYLRYLQAEGILGSELEGTYESAATRATVAHVLANTLPTSALNADEGRISLITQAYASRKFITDVTDYTDYQSDILTLYQYGISQGSDESGSFYPTAAISRGALAAMLTRMVDSSLCVTPSWNLSDAFSAAGTTWGDLIFDKGTYLAAPSTADEVASDVAWMLANGSNELTLQYGTQASAYRIRQVMNEALGDVKSYCEQCYNAVNVSYDSTGTVTLKFSAASCTVSELTSYRTYTLEAAIAVHDALWDSGAITAAMSDYEKAKIYYNWICQNCTYDSGAGDYSLSHIAYALFKNGTAVCDGYTGAYDLLLKLEGIDCWALSNDNHIWTVATLDGTEYHIDTTWGDSSGMYTDYTYFAMTAAQSWSYHRW
ncbi:MAG: S-layer homology domain-containing protein [Oscillibacter sp.]|jgi:hypothetical protein|nr:S-layer homology domain-containing protein [Oscillibacter sp.]